MKSFAWKNLKQLFDTWMLRPLTPTIYFTQNASCHWPRNKWSENGNRSLKKWWKNEILCCSWRFFSYIHVSLPIIYWYFITFFHFHSGNWNWKTMNLEFILKIGLKTEIKERGLNGPGIYEIRERWLRIQSRSHLHNWVRINRQWSPVRMKHQYTSTSFRSKLWGIHSFF